jgi:hypothetical protein
VQKVLLGMALNHKVSLGRLSVLFPFAAGFKTVVVDGQEFGATVRDLDYVVGLINLLGLRAPLQTLMETYGMPSSSSPLHFLKDDPNAPRWVSTTGMRPNIVIWISGDPQLAPKDPWWRGGKKGSKAPGTIFPVLGALAGFIFFNHIDMSDKRNGWLNMIYNADGVLKSQEKNVIVLMKLKYATSLLPSVNLDGGALKGVGSPIVLTAYKERFKEIEYTDDPPLRIWDLGLPERKGIRKEMCNRGLPEDFTDVLSQDVAEWWRYTFWRYKIRGDPDTFSSLSQKAKAFVDCMEYIQLWRHDYLLGMPLFVYLEHLSAETEQALREQGGKGGGAWFPGVISKVNVSVVTVDEKATKVQSLTRQGGKSSLQSPNNTKVVPQVIKAVVSQVTVNFEDMQIRTYSTDSIIIDDGQERWGDGVQTCCKCTSCAKEAAELMNTDSQEEVEKQAPVTVRLRGWTGYNTIFTDKEFKSIVTDEKLLTSFNGRFGPAAVITKRAELVNLGDRGENEREHGSVDQMLSEDPASGGDERESAYSRRLRKKPFRYSARD